MPNGSAEASARTILLAKGPAAAVGLRDRVRAALTPGPAWPDVTPDLVAQATLLLSGGAWPADLPDRLGVPRSRWDAWVSEGAIDFEADRDTPKASLASTLRRATAAIEAHLREQVQQMAEQKGAWQAPAKLLGWLNPSAYSDKVLGAVSAEVERLLQTAKDRLPPEQFEALVRALEDGQG